MNSEWLGRLYLLAAIEREVDTETIIAARYEHTPLK